MTIDELDHYISNTILTKNRLWFDVEGAPFRIGQRVKILDNPGKDETFDMKFANIIGEVKFFEYESGCGQSFPEDPMIGVEIVSGERDGFWREELESIL